MSILTSKLLKIGGPTLTGIGGVIATSSLISKSAKEKRDEKIKTKALSDEDPTIKEWKDRNESDQEGNGDGSPTSGSESSDTEQKQGEGAASQTSSTSTESEGTTTDQDESSSEPAEGQSEASQGAESKENEDQQSEHQSSSDEQDVSNNNGVTESGSTTAENNHASGTAYGNMDRAMTQQELTQVQLTMDSLKDLKNQLSQIPGIDFS
ncbi:hypothetical protein MHC_03925 [Mycoplasma haemocanis str. Illinois]|uniref:Uncharacterized protein n=1 Tax=Mycoplasma haemocanis (strain Illinois) TaxID=1111676 RepID=H6N7M1_MYCHN|nr:hypothetical protein [Mycoplasma haemocanis]AEW45643.1 hypothetical protein MHC_03925 [Mycoplasma haemocanis str. Illinois]